MNTRRFKYDVFVSHASDDKAEVLPFVERLVASGVKVWLDEEQTPVAGETQEAITEGTETCRHVIIWCTATWLRQDWTQWALDRFQTLRSDERQVIPVLHVERDVGRLGSLLTRPIAVLADVSDDERLWLVWCAIRQQSPGPRPEWHKKAAQLVEGAEESSSSAPDDAIFRRQAVFGAAAGALMMIAIAAWIGQTRGDRRPLQACPWQREISGCLSKKSPPGGGKVRMTFKPGAKPIVECIECTEGGYVVERTREYLQGDCLPPRVSTPCTILYTY